jgi:flavin reductase (DIM6/NTAB) family NADH-FMN oxidoreductase RutF
VPLVFVVSPDLKKHVAPNFNKKRRLSRGRIPFVPAFPRLYDGRRLGFVHTGQVKVGAMVSKQLYRDGMARFAAAVHIVTTDGPAGPAGFTASAACSVTDEPPTLLVCLNRASDLHTIFQQNAVFCVNTLAGDQRELSEIFAHRAGMPMSERFALPVWEKRLTGAPVLRGALASFDCRLMGAQEVGTHWVMYGGVDDVQTSQRTSALLYVHRSYRSLEL